MCVSRGGSLAAVRGHAAPPCFLLLSQHPEDLKPAFCNYTKKPFIFFPKDSYQLFCNLKNAVFPRTRCPGSGGNAAGSTRLLARPPGDLMLLRVPRGAFSPICRLKALEQPQARGLPCGTGRTGDPARRARCPRCRTESAPLAGREFHFSYRKSAGSALGLWSVGRAEEHFPCGRLEERVRGLCAWGEGGKNPQPFGVVGFVIIFKVSLVLFFF